MPKYIYLITDEAVSDDAHHSCFSKMAVESSKEAFDMLRRITSENDGGDNNVEWGFNFDRTAYARRVEVIGIGLFPFDVNNKMKELHGTRTISIEEIWLKERVRNECPLD